MLLSTLDADGDSPYRAWFESLNSQAAAKVTVALTRIELGNLSTSRASGQGSRNSGSISGQGTGSTSARTATGSWFCWREVPRAASRRTSRQRRSDGPTTRGAKKLRGQRRPVAEARTAN